MAEKFFKCIKENKIKHLLDSNNSGTTILSEPSKDMAILGWELEWGWSQGGLVHLLSGFKATKY